MHPRLRKDWGRSCQIACIDIFTDETYGTVAQQYLSTTRMMAAHRHHTVAVVSVVVAILAGRTVGTQDRVDVGKRWTAVKCSYSRKPRTGPISDVQIDSSLTDRGFAGGWNASATVRHRRCRPGLFDAGRTLLRRNPLANGDCIGQANRNPWFAGD